MKKKQIRMAVDIAMTALLPCLMAYSLIGETFHEAAGTAMLALFVAHHVLNGAWHRGLFRGRYSPYRVLLTAVNALLCAIMVCLPLSGIMMSKHLFTWLGIKGMAATARTVHLLASYWGFVLMSLHLGLHLDAMLKKKPIWLCAPAVPVALYGIRAFVRRQLPLYMTLRSRFVFFDFGEPLAAFVADYLAIMALFSAAGYAVGWLLRQKKS